jgi:hypothetical protein
MPVTLAQAKLNVTDAVDIQIIDEFQKSNDLLNRLTFDDAVSPAGGGATLTYSYTRQLTQRGAAFRAINSEYTPTEATKVRASVDLKPLGGSFQIDRVLDGVGQARETAFQMRELLKATSAQFSDSVFNGDTAVDANGFDGLNKILTGSSTEYLPLSNGASTGYVDWTTINTQAGASPRSRTLMRGWVCWTSARTRSTCPARPRPCSRPSPPSPASTRWTATVWAPRWTRTTASR